MTTAMPNAWRRAVAVAAAAAAALTVAVSIPAAAGASTTSVTECGEAQTVFGIHGINQGPSVGKDGITGSSPELNTFQADLAKIDNDIDFETVAYPDTKPDTILQLGLRYVQDGAANLQTAVAAAVNDNCPQYRAKSISLVGYSMGAWVVHDWMIEHPGELGYISSVVLYGDPCWTDKNNDEGLARLFEHSIGCDAASVYPNPSARSPFLTRSYTLPSDPVTGYGFHAGGNPLVPTVEGRRAHQLADAIGCHGSCPHLQYQAGHRGAAMVESAAQLVASRFDG